MRRMVNRNWVKFSAASCMIAGLGVFVISPEFQNAQCDSAHLTTLQPELQSIVLLECNNQQNRVSWTTWLLNRSKSTQFHFLDLLELLS